ncbi:MAG: nicotinate phosphoribosyltransferase [Candidatus Marinimicrobia bacterium]|nr:nicotinate phosphoribosyltransferase [Candidatus Neomarinimicrobiota bacterium]MCF7828633.1 nicotinate phosphoribosyltransferase [Candidatus Neomarinimicrobiota bacterium]MCF7880374.1 nicotinate phosphoribosyltransferase [Candidatus Neomarinimicrobiota bacterium]
MKSIVSQDQIKAGKVTDVYFERTRQILEEKNIHKTVTAEFVCKGFPGEYEWAIFAGLNEAAEIIKDLPIDIEAVPEGSVFHEYEPVLTLTGDYLDFGIYETAILGYLCQASGIATKAARCRKAAGEKPMVSFGARRMHPAIAPVVERNAYIGGCDGVASVAAAEYLGQDPVGTIPHALILIMGDTVEATNAFNEIIDEKVNRISLVDTFSDEKFETLRVAESLGDALFGVRLDTPSSRRGDLLEIMKEVRWELDLRGFDHVKLFVSGGLDEYTITEYNSVADAYGVGTSVSTAPVIDFSLDIVDIEGEPMAKRGKTSGQKMLWRCESCLRQKTVPKQADAPGCMECRTPMQPLLKQVKSADSETIEISTHKTVRDYVLKQLPYISLDLP